MWETITTMIEPGAASEMHLSCLKPLETTLWLIVKRTKMVVVRLKYPWAVHRCMIWNRERAETTLCCTKSSATCCISYGLAYFSPSQNGQLSVTSISVIVVPYIFPKVCATQEITNYTSSVTYRNSAGSQAFASDTYLFHIPKKRCDHWFKLQLRRTVKDMLHFVSNIRPISGQFMYWQTVAMLCKGCMSEIA